MMDHQCLFAEFCSKFNVGEYISLFDGYPTELIQRLNNFKAKMVTGKIVSNFDSQPVQLPGQIQQDWIDAM